MKAGAYVYLVYLKSLAKLGHSGLEATPSVLTWDGQRTFTLFSMVFREVAIVCSAETALQWTGSAGVFQSQACTFPVVHIDAMSEQWVATR